MACALNTLPSARAAKPSAQNVPRVNASLANRVVASFPSRSVKACAADAPVITSKPSSSYISTSDKYAIIDVGGVQHLVEEGRWYTCNRLKATPGDVVSFGRVLAVKQDDVFHVGRPYVEGVTVEAEVVEELKGPKVTIYKMQPKKHTRKTVGHRQPLSKCGSHASSTTIFEYVAFMCSSPNIDVAGSIERSRRRSRTTVAAAQAAAPTAHGKA